MHIYIISILLSKNCAFYWVEDEKSQKYAKKEIREGVLIGLNRKWATQEDPIYIRSMLTMDKFVIYLGIRAAYQSIEGSFDERTFDLNDNDKLKWDNFLKAKCDEYGIKFRLASFYILRKHP